MRITGKQAHALFDCFESSGLFVDPDGSARKNFHMEVSVLGHKRWARGPFTFMNEWAKKPPRLTRDGAMDPDEANALEWLNVDILRVMSDSLPIPEEMKNFERVPQSTLEAQTEEQWESLFDRIEQEGPIVITDPSRNDVVMLPVKWFADKFGIDLNQYIDNTAPEERGEAPCYAEPESSTESQPSSS